MNPHAEAQDLLPWLANGTLSGTELERVQAHVKACAACRADLAALHTLRAAGTGAAAPAFDPDDALARLLPQLETQPETPGEAPAPAAVPLPAVRGWRARLAANDARWLRAAVALQCGAIAVLAVLLARPHAETDAGAYRVLGAQPAVQGALVVTFKPDTPERELRRIVLDSGAHIVGGPTVTGAWMLGTAVPAAEVAARLRAEDAVTLAEPLGTQGRP